MTAIQNSISNEYRKSIKTESVQDMSDEIAKVNSLPKRDQIDSVNKWRLEDIYASDSDWEKDMDRVKSLLPEIGAMKGTLGKGAGCLLECLKLSDEIMSTFDKAFVYARMRRDEDNANSYYQGLAAKASSLAATVGAAVSFIIPEIIALPDETIQKYLDSEDSQNDYRHFIDENLRQKKHILSEREEELLALSSEVAQAPKDIFTMLNNADIKFPYIKDEKGEETELTKGRYTTFLESRDRRVREDAFHALYAAYAKQKNTLAALLSGNIKKDIFYKTARSYGSCLEKALDADNISLDVYDNLIQAVNNNLPLLKRYLKLRKKALKLDVLHMYDLYVPIVTQPERKIAYKDAATLVRKGLAALGSSYLADLSAGLDSGWIDVYENEGKTSGAYSWGAYKTHPYVLLNYQGKFSDVFTIAHEMGHALHSYYSNKAQPYINSEYKIFVAEVASTVNEALLMKYLLENTDDRKEKAYFLNHYLEEFRGTVFRQVMFAEFEKATHAMAEAGEALTVDSLCGIYKDLNLKYFAGEVDVDDEIKMEWARIPHFYSSFYVYKYATGFSAAVSLSKQIISEGTAAIGRYMKFLAGGGSDYPLELLKCAGVDLSASKPVIDALDVFGETLDQLEELI